MQKKSVDATIVILGATGDLTKKKLIPAIYNLILTNKLRNFAIIGTAREKVKKEQILNHAKKYIKNIKRSIWNKLVSRFYYHSSDFYSKQKFCDIGGVVEIIERKHGLPHNRIFYLATLPQHFKVIAENLNHCGLLKEGIKGNKKMNWTRVVFEKPFGDDLKSAKQINRTLKKYFKESQIYRIDHYLGKELVENISIARFTNTVLEPLWNKKYIDHVQIVLSEKIGVEKRGFFYDKYGSLKDIMQNHMLQLLALTAMESPKYLSGNYIRDQKLKVLKSVKATSQVTIGQYKGYTKEEGVKKNSRTDTFSAAKVLIDNNRWDGVPFYLLAGKNLGLKLSTIYIQFKQAPCLMFEGICNFRPNYLAIQIEPDAGIYIQMNAKVHEKMDIQPITLDFSHAHTFGANTSQGYENLLFDVMIGDQSVFVRTDEIEEQWKIWEKINKTKGKLQTYKKGSIPSAAKDLIEKDNRYWHLESK